MAKIKFTIITLFPEALQPYLDSSMLYKAQDRGIIEVKYVNLREFGLGPHKSVDDTPYGGGDGMLLRCEPVFAAIESVKSEDPDAEVIIPTPVGMTWNQALARQFAGVVSSQDPNNCFPEALQGSSCSNLASTALKGKASSVAKIKPNISNHAPEALEGQSSSNLAPTQLQGENLSEADFDGLDGKIDFHKHYIILCPHYEGYDERILSIVDHKISLGNYVLTGGELPALIIIDSITRLLPGVLGGATSAEIESFSDGDNLEYPQYTKPAEFRGMKVPDILLSGHHGKVDEWRRAHTKRQNS